MQSHSQEVRETGLEIRLCRTASCCCSGPSLGGAGEVGDRHGLGNGRVLSAGEQQGGCLAEGAGGGVIAIAPVEGLALGPVTLEVSLGVI